MGEGERGRGFGGGGELRTAVLGADGGADALVRDLVLQGGLAGILGPMTQECRWRILCVLSI